MSLSASNTVAVPQGMSVPATNSRRLRIAQAASILLISLSVPLLIAGCAMSGSSTPAAPTFTPAAGTYTSAQTVTVGDATPGAVLFCTTDGTAPTTSSPVCLEPMTVAKTETLSAIAAKPGGSPSAAATAAYVIDLPAAATPVISPIAGTYVAAQSVTITDATASATVYYTTDGTVPTTSSNVYSRGSAINIAATETVMAIAVASGYADSPVATAAFTINLPAPAPVIAPAGGTFTGAQSVTITDSVAGAMIYYTIDGSTPTQTSPIYSGAIAVNATETVNAVAIAPGYSLSPVATAAFHLVAATPTISPAGGSFTTVQTVTLADTTAGANIYYTITPNGGKPVTPTASSTLYTSAIQVAASETIEAIAVANGYTQSAAASAAFTVNLPPAATPVLSSPGGTFSATQTLTITDTTSGAAVYYTTNGSTPSAANGTLYSGPISVNASETIQAIAVAFGNSSSAVASATFNLVAATPLISPAAGTYTSVQSVTITDATAGASIYYTINGPMPSASNGTLYSGPISVSSSETIQAIAIAAGFSNSADATSAFAINLPPAATPVLSSPGGTFNAAQTLTITDATPGAAIYYTTNGSTPSATNGTLYSGPIPVSSSEIIEAIAVASGKNNSAIASATFNLVAATPVISSSGGTFSAAQTVTITDSTAGAAIYYTTNGTTPSATNGTLYSGSISVASSEVLEAIAIETGFSNSAVASSSFTLLAATPKITPAGGTFTTVQSVTITDATAAAAIYYTTNGSAPSATNGTLYAGAFSVSSNETVQAVAVEPGFSNSAVASAGFTINLPAAAPPVISPAGGTFASQSIPTVTLSDATAGAAVYYTLDGSTPSATNGIVYTAPFTAGATETVKAVAVASGYSNSAVASATFTINQAAAATPTFSPSAGTYSTVQTVTLGDTTTGATIYYTIDGSTPSAEHGTVYTTAITVSTTETIKAIAVATGFNNSAVATATFTINFAPAATPMFSPAAGTFSTAQTVSLSDTTTGATIYYTTNGSTPSATNGTVYSGAITVSATETIKAIATATGFTPSAVATATYTISLASAATPTFSPAAGTFSTAQTVSLGDTTTGATIYYTTNGSTPSATNGTVYSGAITVSTTETIKAVATATGFNPSAVATATYTISLTTAATPVFSPAEGTYNSPQTVTITDATPGAAIYYTTDNSTPSATHGTLYSGAITVSAAETVNAIAIASGYSTSAVASAAYTLMAATPAISPAGGTFTTATDTVTITDSTPGAAIYYTITAGSSGVAPTTASTLYSGPFTISASDTVEAIAVETGYTNSNLATAAFTHTTSSGPAVSGTVSSGGSPIIGASVQLYAAGTSGYGSAPTAIGSAVITGASGSFLLPYTCTAAPGDLIYVVATGGSISASGASNAGLGLMTALGPCASLPASGITVNEVTTIASVYALSGFASIATGGGINVGAPATGYPCTAASIGFSTCNYPGLASAFATVNNLVDIGGGAALTITPAYAANPLPYLNTSTVPKARIDTLADILATCVEASSGCSALFGDVGGTTPVDTIQAAFDIARNPGANVATIYGLLQTAPPYSPTLASIGDTAAPQDWTLAITYTGAGLGVDPNNDFNDNITNYAIALDNSGDVWVTGAAANSENTGLIAGFNNQGAPLTPATQYDPVNMFVTQFGGFGPGVSPFPSGVSQLAIDPSNDLWVTTNSFIGGNGNEFAEISVTPVSGSAPALAVVQLSSAYMGAVSTGMSETGFAFDPAVNLWLSTALPDLNEYSSSTGALLHQHAFTESSLGDLAFDSNGSLWGSGAGTTILFNTSTGHEAAKHANTSGAALAAGASGNMYTCNASLDGYFVFNSSKSSGPVSTFSAVGGCNQLVVDGAGNLWSISGTVSGNFLTEVSGTGTLLTPAPGYTGSSSAEGPTTYDAFYLAVDGSGNLWALNQNNSAAGVTGDVLVQFVGVAAPTIPNLAVATQNGAQGTKP